MFFNFSFSASEVTFYRSLKILQFFQKSIVATKRIGFFELLYAINYQILRPWIVLMEKGIKKKGPTGVREILEVLDDQGRVIALLSRQEIHQQRLRHRAVHIFIFDRQGRLYLQKRAAHKDEHPGLWDSSAAGHAKPGEPGSVAARRELQEELGLLCNLLEVARVEASETTGWEFVVLYAGVVNREPRPNPAEIEEGRFFHPQEIEAELRKNPEKFTPSFRLLWRLYLKKGAPKPKEEAP